MIAPPVLQDSMVRLRPVAEADLSIIVGWYNDAAVIHWLHQSDRAAATLADIAERFGAKPTDNDIRWMIETLGGETIGIIRLEGIDMDHGRCELAIAIGEKSHWSGGYGTAAIQLALAHAFDTLEMHRVWLITDVDNARGIRCYEKCGFGREGVLRSHRLRHGEPLDMIMMGVLREEWSASG